MTKMLWPRTHRLFVAVPRLQEGDDEASVWVFEPQKIAWHYLTGCACQLVSSRADLWVATRPLACLLASAPPDLHSPNGLSRIELALRRV